ncbi:MAG: DUF4150 domain-containing protein [Gammaproteobacteria bacterium]|nr:DUF4150 domain-containing protein [Gammaproteobacteria bacterium]
MFFISTTEGGMAQGNPDVCNTPAPPSAPIPVPYPNIAMFNQANVGTCSTKVLIRNKPVFHQTSVIPISTGDEPGSLGGIISGKIKGEAKALTCSLKVMVENKGVVYHTCTISHNGAPPNCPAGIHSVPSQFAVTVTG